MGRMVLPRIAARVLGLSYFSVRVRTPSRDRRQVQ